MRWMWVVLWTLSLGLWPAQHASAQEMTFDPGEVTPRVYVVLLASTALSKGDRSYLITTVEDAVRKHGGYEVLSTRDVKGVLGRHWRKFSRCSDIPCRLTVVADSGVDLLLFVKVTPDGGTTSVDLELDEVATGKLLRFAETESTDINDTGYLDQPMAELLTPETAPKPRTLRPDPPALDPEMVEEPVAAVGPDRTWTYVALGVGAGLVAGGGAFALMADNTQSEIQAKPHTRADLDALIADGERDALLANILYGAGLASLVGAGALFVWAGPEAQGPAPSPPSASCLRIDIGTHGVTALLRF